MARSAAARAPRTAHGRPARTAAKKPLRRASGRAAGGGQAARNADAIRKSAAASKSGKAAPARKAAAGKPGAHKAATHKAGRGKAATHKAGRGKTATRKAGARNGSAPRGSAVRGPAMAAAHAGAGVIALPLPLRVIRAPFTRSLRSRGSGVLDALLQGRGWIGLVAVLLVGIVFFNVDLLKMNRDIAVTSQRASGVARENARLRLELAKLDSSERVQRAAASRGLLLPAPGDVRYLRANPFVDARRAAKLIEAPNSSVALPEPTPQTTAPPAAAPVAAAPQTTTPTPTPASQAGTTTAQPQPTPAAPTTAPQAQAQPGTTTAAPTG
jgi:cell division protein FtsL